MPLNDYVTRTDRLFYTLGRIEGELRLNACKATPDADTVKKIRMIIREYDESNGEAVAVVSPEVKP